MQIRSVGIVGTGLMGTGIAWVAALKGHPVTIVRLRNADDLLKDRTKFYDVVEKLRAADKIGMQEHMTLKTRIEWSADPGALADCDLVIESIVEDGDAKIECFRALDTYVKPQGVFASNTSSLDLAELAVVRPDRFLGLHFFNPVAKMKLVEVASCGASMETLDAALAFLTALGKEPVVVGPSPGMAVNRVLMPMLLEAARAAFTQRPAVAGIKDLDRCMHLGLNHPMGPFLLMDHIGIDVVYAMAINLQESLGGEQFSPPPIFDRMIGEGWLGVKSGKGFYDHADRKNPRPNEEVETLVR
jgi:3-hydroxybutyryl-CoA dehydrogenase